SGKPPSGWSATASSGSRASTGSISICATYSGRKRSMAAGNSVSAPERTLVTTRIYDAPREAVYKAWIDPKQLARWFPPEGFTSSRCEIDARPGGVFRVDMKAPAGSPFNGQVFRGPGEFREVLPDEGLVFTMEPYCEGQQ